MKRLIGKWMSDPGLWSLVDQAVVSSGGFVTTILLARALSTVEYGIFALIFALMLFMYGLHAAVILYGLSLHGALGSDASLRPLAGGSLTLTALLGVVLGSATGAAAIFLHQSKLVPWILFTFLFWQLQEATRRALMSRLRHRDAIWGDALSYLGQAALIAYLFAVHRLTLSSAFQSMAVTSAAGLAFQLAQLKLAPSDFRGGLHLLVKFWSASQWALLVKIAESFMGQALLWFLSFGGIAEVASFQSLLNLLRVTNPVMFAIGSVVLPAVAAQGGTGEALSTVRRYSLLGAVILLPYFTLVVIFPAEALRLLYGAGSVYAGLSLELRVLVLGLAFAYVAHVLTMYYFGRSRSDVVLVCELVAAGVTTVGGLLLIKRPQLLAAAVAYDLTFAAAVMAFSWFLRADSAARLASSKVTERVAG